MTAYDASNKRCQVDSWIEETVSVVCYDSAGNPADSRYSILYVSPDPHDNGLAFAWADQSGSASYLPQSSTSFNPLSFNQAVRTSPGEYGMGFHAFGDDAGFGPRTALVTGYRTGAEKHCSYGGGGGVEQFVQCFDTAGNPTDSRYNILYLRPVTAPEPGAIAMLASGAALVALLARRRGFAAARRSRTV